jgi:predicted adenine nucleotide alpha hydrolase (AANH) superfamily ATPase
VINISVLRISRKLGNNGPTILLHSCCGPCSTAVVERLSGRFDNTVFFYNPNILIRKNNEKRRSVQLDFIEKYNDRIDARDRIAYIDGPYEPEIFLARQEEWRKNRKAESDAPHAISSVWKKTAETARMSGFDILRHQRFPSAPKKI